MAARMSGGADRSPLPMHRRPAGAAASVLAAGLIAGLTLVGCGIGASTAGPLATPTLALPSYSVAIAETRTAIASALAGVNLQLQDATQPFRAPESPSIVAATRGIFQVILPADPVHGYIVVYEFRDGPTAEAAGEELAAYIGTGPGRIQFPPDAQHLIRLVDTTLIAYSWSPANSTDARSDAIPSALMTIGTAIDVPQ
jgi:hypothetical protein